MVPDGVIVLGSKVDPTSKVTTSMDTVAPQNKSQHSSLATMTQQWLLGGAFHLLCAHSQLTYPCLLSLLQLLTEMMPVQLFEDCLVDKKE
jgi:hypothetical protein